MFSIFIRAMVVDLSEDQSAEVRKVWRPNQSVQSGHRDFFLRLKFSNLKGEPIDPQILESFLFFIYLDNYALMTFVLTLAQNFSWYKYIKKLSKLNNLIIYKYILPEINV